jgi:ferritin-like metal-binding protein YciE
MQSFIEIKFLMSSSLNLGKMNLIKGKFMKRPSIQDLFFEELNEILTGEKLIMKALPPLVKAANAPELKKVLESHLDETREHLNRLEIIFNKLNLNDLGKACEGMEGLIDECNETIKSYEKSPLRDAALISKVQKIEHYEISTYATLRIFAKELDLTEVASLLKETLDEEGNLDKKLTKIAEGGLPRSKISPKARTSSPAQSPIKLKQKSAQPKIETLSKKKVG